MCQLVLDSIREEKHQISKTELRSGQLVNV